MVKITFKMSDLGTVEVELDQARQLSQLLEEIYLNAGEKMGGIIAVRDGKVINFDDLVEVDDEITIFPALSGG